MTRQNQPGSSPLRRARAVGAVRKGRLNSGIHRSGAGTTTPGASVARDAPSHADGWRSRAAALLIVAGFLVIALVAAVRPRIGFTSSSPRAESPRSAAASSGRASEEREPCGTPSRRPLAGLDAAAAPAPSHPLRSTSTSVGGVITATSPPAARHALRVARRRPAQQRIAAHQPRPPPSRSTNAPSGRSSSAARVARRAAPSTRSACSRASIASAPGAPRQREEAG